MAIPHCPEHNLPMVRRKSNFGNNYWYGCPKYPECHVSCAEHPNGKLMSTPADAILKALRMRAHDLLVEVFGDWEKKEVRTEIYIWLKDNSKSKHIGLMGKDEILDTITKLKKLKLEKKNV